MLQTLLLYSRKMILYVSFIEHFQFTEKSDIWSFGVLMWEILARNLPYASIDNFDEFKTLLINGGRLARPDSCPPKLYEVIELCWKEDPKLRPNFFQLDNKLKALVDEMKQQMEIDESSYLIVSTKSL